MAELFHFLFTLKKAKSKIFFWFQRDTKIENFEIKALSDSPRGFLKGFRSRLGDITLTTTLLEVIESLLYIIKSVVFYLEIKNVKVSLHFFV